MSKHKAKTREIEKQNFKKKKTVSDESMKSILKDSLHYMNIFQAQAPTMYLCGNESLYIEHYNSIIEYTGARVKLQLPKMQLLLEGTELVLEYFSKNDLKVNGNIERMTFFGSPAPKKGRLSGYEKERG